MISLPRWLALSAIVLIALALRTWKLDARPMHADEANQGVKAGELLETGHYAFNPEDHHGPTLYFAAVPVARLRGERSLAELTETTLRLVPALFGTIAVLLLARLDSGREPSATGLLAAAFLALNPPSVYYARDFIQETLLVCFTLLLVSAAARWWTRGRLGWAVLAGAAGGLMIATKETAVVLLIALALATLAVRPPAPVSRRPLRDIALSLAAAVLVAALLYSSFGTHIAGLRDAVAAPFHGLGRATGATGHEKPWSYYLQILTYRSSGGLVWHQLPLVALALVGAGVAFASRQPWLRAAAVYAAVLLVAISCVPYKTPWNVLHVLPPLCLLAAGAITALPFRAQSRSPRTLALLAGTAVCGIAAVLLYRQVRLAVFLRPADARNPWAYVHSSPDVRKYRAIAEAAYAAHPNEPIRVIGEEYWPLPWYLRGLPNVGYWSTPPADCDGALVIASATQAEQVRSQLKRSYDESILGLRPGVLCVVFRRTTAP